MQLILNRMTTLIGLAIAAIASVAVLLYISIERNFLPGVVELSVALGVALIFGVVALMPKASRQSVQRQLGSIRISRIRFAAAGVAILALTAVLAFFLEDFPWPAPLLLVVVTMLYALRETDSQN